MNTGLQLFINICVGLLKLAVLVFLFYEGDKLIKKLKRNNRHKKTTPSERRVVIRQFHSRQ